MRLNVIAVDYDGTIAEEGRLHPDVHAAIKDVGQHGMTVILVTGRILSDLRQVAGDLRFVDAVVGENGAVMAFPRSGRSTVLAHPPPDAFLAALQARGVDIAVGECVVEADAVCAHDILAVVREMELPLTLLFNRSRLMVLPQGVSKATGLHEVLRTLRLSRHNTVAIGDAENDHALLEASELGVAVGWGSATLRARADVVLDGTGPAAVASYIRRIAAASPGEIAPAARHALIVGTSQDGLQVPVRSVGRNVLIAGDPRSGKSWAAGLLCEQLILQGYCVCVIDPEGDYRPLQSLPGTVLVGGEDPPPRPRDVVRALRHPDVSVVIDLSTMAHAAKRDTVRALLPVLATLRRSTGLPHSILVDEAHYFLHDPDAGSLMDLDLGGYMLVTYRMSRLHQDVLRTMQAAIFTRVTDDQEIGALSTLLKSRGDERSSADLFGGLSVSEAVLVHLAGEERGSVERLKLGPRLTPHVRHRQKYVDVPVPEGHAFMFAADGQPQCARARTLTEFIRCVSTVPEAVLDNHLRRGDFSRWIADVFGDNALASRLQNLEELYESRHALDVRDAIIELVEERYVLTDRVP